MTVQDLLGEFRKLGKQERLQFLSYAGELNRSLGTEGLRVGQLVQFKESRTGAIIKGTFKRMKQKYAEIESDQNKYGLQMAYKVRWSVPPSMLTPVQS